MFKYFFNIFKKRKLLKNVQYISDRSEIIFGKNVEVTSSNSSRIQLNGKLILGIPLNGISASFSHKSNTVFSLEKNATLIINGDVHIAPGCTIRVGENATLELAGKNIIAHDTIIIASKHLTIGENSSISWNCTLIDDDAHSFFTTDGRKIKKTRKTLIIGANVGIQMNVTIPSGGSIGKNSIISANTVIRSNVPEDTLVYSLNEFKQKKGFTTGFQYL